MIENPVLRGFNPDPSMIRVGQKYYIATSTFEWYGSIQIHASCDLVNWRFVRRVLYEDFSGICDGGGIWAPCLTYSDGTYYLVYTVVRERGAMMQTDNYLITTHDIEGEWSKPAYLHSLGFDPSLFHDNDGKKWLLSLNNHHTSGKRFNGIWIWQYDAKNAALVGEPRLLYSQKGNELVEGCHIYRHEDFYYLMKAQGGTGRRHSTQLSRSRTLLGEYEDCPFILLHSRDNNALALQCAGHSSLVETPCGEYYISHLATRRSCEHDFCYFGRETALQKVFWGNDGWLHLENGGENPSLNTASLFTCEDSIRPAFTRYDFKKGVLSSDFQSLRTDITSAVSFCQHGLILRGTQSLMSKFFQSLFARRIDTNFFSISVSLMFEPLWEKHMAGIVIYYNTNYWHYLCVTRLDDSKKKVVRIISCDAGTLSFPSCAEVREETPLLLKMTAEGCRLSCCVCDGEHEFCIGEPLSMHIVSEEYVPLGFTGAMAGFCCQDLSRQEKTALFEYFEYATHGTR
ncbi:MAG: family 43 glycosylhydrolase [Clostridia bacterium]|nr:family 43 glycosylhydrolase [Clostridia bacterium]